LALSPRYAHDRLVYAYFTSDTDNRIVRFQLGGGLRPILTGIRRADIHDGGRIAFGPDGKLYASVGEATSGRASSRLSDRGGTVDSGVPGRRVGDYSPTLRLEEFSCRLPAAPSQPHLGGFRLRHLF
jgi:glucose/arabinose dehydrogenase